MDYARAGNWVTRPYLNLPSSRASLKELLLQRLPSGLLASSRRSRHSALIELHDSDALKNHSKATL